MSDNISLRTTIEAAVRDFLRQQAISVQAMSNVQIDTRTEVKARYFPRVVVEALRAPAQDDCNNLYMVQLMVYLGTQATEPDAAARHKARLGFLQDALGADEGAALIAATAAHPDINIHKVFVSDDAGEQTGEHWLEVLEFLIPAQVKG